MFSDRTATPLPSLAPDFSAAMEEAGWRTCARLSNFVSAPRVTLSHWRDRSEGPRSLSAPILTAHYTIEVFLRSAIVDCFRNDRRITTGTVGFGGTQIAAPGEAIRCDFRRPVESIHLFVPSSIIVKTYEELQQSTCPDDYRLVDPAFKADPIMGRLGSTLLEATTLRSPFAGLYCESLAMAVLARAMEFESSRTVSSPRRGLAPWRLRRAIAYIEDHLAEPITLNEIAEHAGLSRMHFAAQFKRATGFSPHAFLLMRRLDTAKSLLIEDRLPIVQIAFKVGFNSQAHFTSVFRKATGITPGQWRRRSIRTQPPIPDADNNADSDRRGDIGSKSDE